uniref:Ig-like domain-containing protein n=1 Tax=Erpetoichthys calabaricus TaxID=27687 RepID=A0A8C4RLL2_ERPCA
NTNSIPQNLTGLHRFFSKYLSFSGQTLTQPTSASAQPGQTVSLTCKASSSIGSNLHWYHQIAGQAPKLLIRYATNRQSGIPERFSGQYSGTDFTLQISGVQPEDAGYYYCHTYDNKGSLTNL